MMVARGTSRPSSSMGKHGNVKSGDANESNTASTTSQGGKQQGSSASQQQSSSSAAASKNLSPQEQEMLNLKNKYKSQLHTLRQLFSETWKDDDLIAVLQEVNGDLDTAIGRISEGHAEQWSAPQSRKQRREKKPDQMQQSSSQPQQSHSGYGYGQQSDYGQDSNHPHSANRRVVGSGTRGRGRGRARGGRSMGATTRQDYSRGNASTTNGSYDSQSSRRYNERGAEDSNDNSWSSAAYNSGKSSGGDGNSWSNEPVSHTAAAGTSWDDASSTAATAGSVISSHDLKQQQQQNAAESFANQSSDAAASGKAGWGTPSKKQQSSPQQGQSQGGWSGSKATSDQLASTTAALSGDEGSVGIKSGWGTVSSQSSGAAKSARTSAASGQQSSKSGAGKSTWAQIARPEQVMQKIVENVPLADQGLHSQRVEEVAPPQASSGWGSSDRPRSKSPAKVKSPVGQQVEQQEAASTTGWNVPVSQSSSVSPKIQQSHQQHSPSSAKTYNNVIGSGRSLSGSESGVLSAGDRSVSNAAVGSVGVRFGTLGLNDDSDSVPVAQKPLSSPLGVNPVGGVNASRTPAAQQQQQPSYLMGISPEIQPAQVQQASSSDAGSKPVAGLSHLQQQAAPLGVGSSVQSGGNSYAQYQTQPAAGQSDYSSIYSHLSTASNANPLGQFPHQAGYQQQQQFPGQQQQQQPHNVAGYGLNPANLANMYAAYFPYYASQFGVGQTSGIGAGAFGANPAYGGHQSPFMNKFPMYNTGVGNSGTGQSNPNQPQQQQQQSQQSRNSPYGGGYYPGAQPQQQQQHHQNGGFAGTNYSSQLQQQTQQQQQQRQQQAQQGQQNQRQGGGKNPQSGQSSW
ncbi:hypothetical protein MP228_007787 [Amoeboaphelidium protococcarum]|nr:hypothetical protein MP228_007787 [Amoeboaphelidium protococcarum]